MITSQPFVLVPCPPDVIAMTWSDSMLLACASCKAIIENGTMEHSRDCGWLQVVVMFAAEQDAALADKHDATIVVWHDTCDSMEDPHWCEVPFAPELRGQPVPEPEPLADAIAAANQASGDETQP